MLAGGVFNMVFTGTGRLVVSAFGTPVVLNTADAPTYADVQSAIAWSGSRQTRLVRTAGAAALIGRGSGETFQLAFQACGLHDRPGLRRAAGAQAQPLTSRQR